MSTPVPPGWNDPHNWGPAPLASADGWLPGDVGLLAASGDADNIATQNTGALTAGTLYLVKIQIRQPIVACGHVAWPVQATGTGASTQTFTGLYDPAGKLIVGSADVSASLTPALTLASCALSSAVPLTVPFVWAALLLNFATTQPSLFRPGIAGTIVMFNGALPPWLLRFCANGTGLSALPASINPAANTIAGATTMWAGLAA